MVPDISISEWFYSSGPKNKVSIKLWSKAHQPITCSIVNMKSELLYKSVVNRNKYF